jgi:hypothetical protein
VERHAWALHSLQEASPGPSAMRHFEQSLAAVASTPLDMHGRFALLAIVDDYVFGHPLRAREVRARAATTEAARDLSRSQLETARFLHTGSRPRRARRGPKSGTQELVDRGLEMLLDSAAARLGLSPPTRPTRPPPGSRSPDSRPRSRRRRPRSGR